MSQGTSPESILGGSYHLPRTVEILPRLLALARNPNSQMVDLVDLVRDHDAIATNLLKIANRHLSDAVGESIESLDEAGYQLGFRRVYDYTSMLIFRMHFHKPLARYQVEADAFVARAVMCALLMDKLASVLPDADEFAYYTTGLMHACGQVAINEFLVQRRRYLALGPNADVEETARAEQDAAGFNHAEVSVTMLRLWGFSPDIVETVRGYLDDLNSKTMSRSAACLRLCALLPAPHSAEMRAQGAAPYPENALRNLLKGRPELLECTGIDRAAVEKSLQAAVGVFHYIEQFFA